MASGTFYPAVSGDDGYWTETGTFNNSGSSARFKINYNTFIRFPAVNIPQDAVISNAYIKFISYANDTGYVNIDVYMNNVDNAVAPTSKAECDALAITSRAPWVNVESWSSGGTYYFLDFASTLQLIIDRPGWNSGQAMQTILKNASGVGERYYRTKDYPTPGNYPVLYVTWNEITLNSAFSSINSLSSNCRISLNSNTFSTVNSLTIDTILWNEIILESAFSSANSATSNLQIILNSNTFSTVNALIIGSIFWGYPITLASVFSSINSMTSNLQVAFVPDNFSTLHSFSSNLQINYVPTVFITVNSMTMDQPIIFILDNANRVYIFTLTGYADGTTDIEIPIKSFQSRMKSGDPTFLSVVIPGVDYLSYINARLNGQMVIRIGYKDGSTLLLSEIIATANFENIRYDEGSTNKSITLEGHLTETFLPKIIILEDITYKNITKGLLRFRCQPNLYLKPGDTANAGSDSLTVASITYSVSPGQELYEVAE